jgi:hypothetical protein
VALVTYRDLSRETPFTQLGPSPEDAPNPEDVDPRCRPRPVSRVTPADLLLMSEAALTPYTKEKTP